VWRSLPVDATGPPAVRDPTAGPTPLLAAGACLLVKPGRGSRLVASLLSAAVTAQVKGRLADQLQAALEHRWLIEQAKDRETTS
jgi:hypothetical protein